jgi:hypothetical protein
MGVAEAGAAILVAKATRGMKPPTLRDVGRTASLDQQVVAVGANRIGMT